MECPRTVLARLTKSATEPVDGAFACQGGHPGCRVYRLAAFKACPAGTALLSQHRYTCPDTVKGYTVLADLDLGARNLMPALGSHKRDDRVASKAQAGFSRPALNVMKAYPNPFRESATISYELLAACRVRPSVYDVLGRGLAELVVRLEPVGHQTAIMDGSRWRLSVPSGGWEPSCDGQARAPQVVHQESDRIRFIKRDQTPWKQPPNWQCFWFGTELRSNGFHRRWVQAGQR